jgi:hypothetical protein
MKPIDEIQLTPTPSANSPRRTRRNRSPPPPDPAARAAVEEIRALAAQLETELKNAPSFLTDDQRRRVLQPPAPAAGRLARFSWRRATGFAAVAAAVTLVFGGVLWQASRNLLQTRFAKLCETSEPAISCEIIQTDSQTLDELLVPAELPDMVDIVTPPDLDLEMTAPPEIQDFAAAPAMDSVTE